MCLNSFLIRGSAIVWTMDEGHTTPAGEDSAFHPVVVVPTYNNAKTLVAVLRMVEAQSLPIIVVDDGSTDATAADLCAWLESPDAVKRQVLRHDENRGKAAALKTGFEAANEAGYTHAVTLDSDGQLDPTEIHGLLDAARQHPASLVVGVRDAKAADYPSKSRLGRAFSNAMVKLECGVRVSDSQCGFRVYPLGLIEAVHCGFGRYALETEILTRAVWAGAGIVEHPVTCRYDVPAGRVTHFRPLMDTLHGVLLHARLMLRALLPIPYPHAWHDPNGREKLEHDTTPLWRRFLRWLNPLTAWRGIRAGDLRRDELAVGLALGVFIGNLPVYGLHTVMCLYASVRMHLNPSVVVVGSCLFATPPLGLVFIALSIATGHFILQGAVISLDSIHVADQSWAQLIGRFFFEWAVGSLVVGVVMALLTGLSGYAFFGWLQRRSGTSDEDLAVVQADQVEEPESA